jgi:predicted ABC-type sugar transport system permease subunit
MDPKKKKLFVIAVILVVEIAAVIAGWIILPQTLVMQVTFSGQAGTQMPKAAGLAIPIALSLFFLFRYYKNDPGTKDLLLSLLGPIMYVSIFAFNFALA